MRIIKSVRELLSLRRKLGREGVTLGLVPTMGALHEGHASLVHRSVLENDRTMVSIFVNPTQFNDRKDYRRYPATPKADERLLAAAGADYLFRPNYRELYPDDYRYRVSEGADSLVLCGAHRPGHFDGVLTVVMKLLNLAGADRAYFGEKDYQQYRLVSGMAEAFFLPTKIIPCPIVRAKDGLALSSRNALLSSSERTAAPRFHYHLSYTGSDSKIRRALERDGFIVDYVTSKWGRRFGAVRLGGVRLIDNVEI